MMKIGQIKTTLTSDCTKRDKVKGQCQRWLKCIKIKKNCVLNLSQIATENMTKNCIFDPFLVTLILNLTLLTPNFMSHSWPIIFSLTFWCKVIIPFNNQAPLDVVKEFIVWQCCAQTHGQIKTIDFLVYLWVYSNEFSDSYWFFYIRIWR